MKIYTWVSTILVIALCTILWSFNTRTSVAQSNVSPGKRVLGITVRNNADYNLIKDAGIDRYFGSWQVGGPQDWVPLIDEVYALTHKPVFINEWGYSSIQGSGVALDRKVGNPICEGQSWKNVWRKEHSPEEQAAYIETALKIFATYPHVGGAFVFAWRDSDTCYHCGSKGCPAECGWGIVDSEGKPKPAYYTVKAVAHEYF